jgi:beta-phosphoglucomutase-like phosphatase (HAD superfamily)
MSLAGRRVLFDLDGTLVDSSPGIHASVRSAAAELGLPEPTAAQLSRHGRPAAAGGLRARPEGAALAAHPDGRDPLLVGDRSHDVLEDAGAAVVLATPAEVLPVLERKIW